MQPCNRCSLCSALSLLLPTVLRGRLDRLWPAVEQEEKAHDAKDLFPGLEPRGVGAPGNLPSSIQKLVQ